MSRGKHAKPIINDEVRTTLEMFAAMLAFNAMIFLLWLWR